MKKKKNSTLVLVLLIAVVFLGIGYAATTITLKINGTATAKESTDFKVYFTEATPDADKVTGEKESTAQLVSPDSEGHSLVAEMTVTLTNVGDSQTGTFKIENGSAEGIKAVLNKDNIKICKDADCANEFTSDYFDVVTSLNDSITIPSKKGGADNTKTFTVTVSLKKAAVEEQTENFYVVLKDIEAGQE